MSVASAKAVVVRIYGVVSGVRTTLPGAGVHMHVDVDQPRGHVEALGVDDLSGASADRILDGRDPTVLDRHIHDSVKAVARIHDVAASNQ